MDRTFRFIRFRISRGNVRILLRLMSSISNDGRSHRTTGNSRKKFDRTLRYRSLCRPTRALGREDNRLCPSANLSNVSERSARRDVTGTHRATSSCIPCNISFGSSPILRSLRSKVLPLSLLTCRACASTARKETRSSGSVDMTAEEQAHQTALEKAQLQMPVLGGSSFNRPVEMR